MRQDHNKNNMRTKIYLKKVTNETCNNVRNCKMIMMSSLKLAKIVNEKEQYGKVHPKC
jgi:hypothetical protein